MSPVGTLAKPLPAPATAAAGTILVTANLENYGQQVAPPLVTPSSGNYAVAGSVTINASVATVDAVIRYTSDGTDPTPSSTLYTGSFVVGP